MRLSTALSVLSLVLCFAGTALAQYHGLRFIDSGPFSGRDRRQAACPNCVLLTDCPAMLRLLASRTKAGIYSVQRAICGFEGQRSLVCCPPLGAPPAPATTARPRMSPLPTLCGYSNEFNRIFGGKETSIGGFPWVVALGYLRPGNDRVQFHCSGSLISKRYILTAAHCLDPATLRGRRLAEIRLGEWDLTKENDCQEGDDGQECAPPYRRVFMESAIIHPTYARRFQYSDDVALIRLTEALDLAKLSPSIAPVCLPPTFAPGLTAVGEKVVAAGWGMTEAGRLSDTLQQVELPIVENARCQEVYGSAFGDRQICAGGSEGKDTCSGDSGGPLVKSSGGPPYIQVGVVSFGLAVCGTNNTPAVYTSVADFREWIVSNMLE